MREKHLLWLSRGAACGKDAGNVVSGYCGCAVRERFVVFERFGVGGEILARRMFGVDDEDTFFGKGVDVCKGVFGLLYWLLF